MKIFHLTTGAPFGGMERQMERLAALLQQEGFEQRVMFNADAARAARLTATGIIPIEMNYPSRFQFLDRRRINSVIRKFAPDVVVSWVPEMANLVERGNFTHIGRLPPASDVTSLVNREHLFMPATSRGGFAFAAGWASDKVHVIPHLPRRDDAELKPVNRKTYYTPPMAKLIVTAMRLTRDSGLETLLDAVARLSGYFYGSLATAPTALCLKLRRTSAALNRACGSWVGITIPRHSLQRPMCLLIRRNKTTWATR